MTKKDLRQGIKIVNSGITFEVENIDWETMCLFIIVDEIKDDDFLRYLKEGDKKRFTNLHNMDDWAYWVMEDNSDIVILYDSDIGFIIDIDH